MLTIFVKSNTGRVIPIKFSDEEKGRRYLKKLVLSGVKISSVRIHNQP